MNCKGIRSHGGDCTSTTTHSSKYCSRHRCQLNSTGSWKDFCYFLDTSTDGKLYIGTFPNKTEVNTLEELNIKHCFDLTTPQDHLPPVFYKYPRINFPIKDMNIPPDMTFFWNLIKNIDSLLVSGQNVYVHCLGGHGRGGLVGGSYLVFKEMDSVNALTAVYLSHQKRIVMTFKKRIYGAPQTRIQKEFVHEFAKWLRKQQINS